MRSSFYAPFMAKISGDAFSAFEFSEQFPIEQASPLIWWNDEGVPTRSRWITHGIERDVFSLPTGEEDLKKVIQSWINLPYAKGRLACRFYPLFFADVMADLLINSTPA